MVFTHCHPGTLPNFSRGVIQVFYWWICLFGWCCHSSHMLLRSSHAWYQLFCGVSFSGPVEHVQLLTPFVVIRNKEVNITAVVLPSHSRTVTYFWWLGNNTEVILPVQGSLIYSSVLVSIAYRCVDFHQDNHCHQVISPGRWQFSTWGKKNSHDVLEKYILLLGTYTNKEHTAWALIKVFPN